MLERRTGKSDGIQNQSMVSPTGDMKAEAKTRKFGHSEAKEEAQWQGRNAVAAANRSETKHT